MSKIRFATPFHLVKPNTMKTPFFEQFRLYEYKMLSRKQIWANEGQRQHTLCYFGVYSVHLSRCLFRSLAFSTWAYLVCHSIYGKLWLLSSFSLKLTMTTKVRLSFRVDQSTRYQSHIQFIFVSWLTTKFHDTKRMNDKLLLTHSLILWLFVSVCAFVHGTWVFLLVVLAISSQRLFDFIYFVIVIEMPWSWEFIYIALLLWSEVRVQTEAKLNNDKITEKYRSW